MRSDVWCTPVQPSVLLIRTQFVLWVSSCQSASSTRECSETSVQIHQRSKNIPVTYKYNNDRFLWCAKDWSSEAKCFKLQGLVMVNQVLMEAKELAETGDGSVEVQENPTAWVRYIRQQKQAKVILMFTLWRQHSSTEFSRESCFNKHLPKPTYEKMRSAFGVIQETKSSLYLTSSAWGTAEVTRCMLCRWNDMNCLYYE